jgi:dTDP-4-amino-4,6-dideoxygalactose transaminase
MKISVDDLAVFGGAPLFSSIRPRAQLAVGDRDAFFHHTESVYSSKWLTNFGPLVKALEQRLCEYHQTDHCVTFSNACLAILALFHDAKGNREYGNVAMPAFTYDGLPHLARWAGLDPLFCDIDPSSLTLDPKAVANAVNHDTVAIIGVNQVNSPCDIDGLQKVADNCAIPLYFDSVYGVHCTLNGHPIGGFGHAEVFSLHATKLINGFEGGYITTNDKNLAYKLWRISTFGFVAKDTVGFLGMNGKLNEIHAAMALTSLDAVEATAAMNYQRYCWYEKYFSGIPGWSIMPPPAGDKNNNCFVIFHIDPGSIPGRDAILLVLRKENGLAAPYYSPPLHLSEHMPEGIDVPSLPVTEKASAEYILMPVGELVDEETIRNLALLAAFIQENAEEITQRLVV